MINAQEVALRTRIQKAVEAGLVSPPQVAQCPPGFPFHTATCAVELPDGCVAPRNAFGRRIAVGRSDRQEDAEFFALAEAVERYSLQYHGDLPKVLKPFASSEAPGSAVPVEELCLGAPRALTRVTSVGAAAGLDLETAAQRAILELIENFHVGSKIQPEGLFRAVDLYSLSDLANLMGWLHGQCRVLEGWVARSGEDYFVAYVALSDIDGGRRTAGSAAGLSLRGPLVHAAMEAVFHWRNMVALEYHGAEIDAMSEEDRTLVARYRGAIPRETFPELTKETPALSLEQDIVLSSSPADLMTALSQRTEPPIRLFDMTHPMIGIPVVKALLG